MGSLFFDESKHPEQGFCVGAWVFSTTDPDIDVSAALEAHGLMPGVDEFKSSARMDGAPLLRSLRADLANIVFRRFRIAVCVVRSETDLMKGALNLLAAMLTHDDLRDKSHICFLDEGIRSGEALERIAERALSPSQRACLELRPEQDSKKVLGLQLADLVCHTASTMLLDQLGLIRKATLVGFEAGYPDDTEISLGFELWARMRHSFLSTYPQWRAQSQDKIDMATVEVEPVGLFVATDLDDEIACASRARFGEMYLGCIH